MYIVNVESVGTEMLEYDVANPGGGVARGLGSGEGAGPGAALVTATPDEL
jgi:hypothetical protein